jgi:hypothetical protein
MSINAKKQMPCIYVYKPTHIHSHICSKAQTTNKNKETNAIHTKDLTIHIYVPKHTPQIKTKKPMP